MVLLVADDSLIDASCGGDFVSRNVFIVAVFPDVATVLEQHKEKINC